MTVPRVADTTTTPAGPLIIQSPAFASTLGPVSGTSAREPRCVTAPSPFAGGGGADSTTPASTACVEGAGCPHPAIASTHTIPLARTRMAGEHSPLAALTK